MDAITEKLFPILATPQPQLPACSTVYLSSVFIFLVHYGKCDMANGSWTTQRRVSCGNRVARVKIWAAEGQLAFFLPLLHGRTFFFAFDRWTKTAPKREPFGRQTEQNRHLESSECTQSASGPTPLENTCRLLSVLPSVQWRDRNKRGKVTERVDHLLASGDRA